LTQRKACLEKDQILRKGEIKEREIKRMYKKT